MNNVFEELWELSTRLSLVKVEELLAKKKRTAIEEQIALLIPGPDTGQKTVTLKDGLKITVKRGLNYKADLPEVAAVLVQNADDSLPVPVKTKTVRELDTQGYEWYRINHPRIFALIAKHVVVTRKKVAVSLKAAEEVRE